MTRADDVNAPPQTACEAVTCKIITYSLGGIMCSPLMCCGVFADGAQALKRQHQLSKDNKVLQDVIGPTIQRMV